MLKKHYESKPVIIAKCFHFYRRDQASKESIAEYLAEFRRLATHCQCGECLEEALRDRFVCGLRNGGTQKHLLSETEPLPLKKAIELALAVEAVDKNARELQGAESTQLGIGRIEKGHSSHKNKKPCHRCGKHDHQPNNCKYREFVCYNCSKKGHLAKVCHKPQTDQRTTTSRNDTSNGRTKWVETTDKNTLKTNEAIFCLKETRTRSFVLNLH